MVQPSASDLWTDLSLGGLSGHSGLKKRHDGQKCSVQVSPVSMKRSIKIEGPSNGRETHSYVAFQKADTHEEGEYEKERGSPLLSALRCFMDEHIFAALQIYLHIINLNSLILNIYAQLVTSPKKQLRYIMLTASIKPLKLGSVTQHTMSLHC